MRRVFRGPQHFANFGPIPIKIHPMSLTHIHPGHGPFKSRRAISPNPATKAIKMATPLAMVKILWGLSLRALIIPNVIKIIKMLKI